MTSDYSKVKGRGKRKPRYFGLPYALYNSPNYQLLSANAVRLLIDIGIQFNGKNNGDLCAALSVIKKHGLRSADTLNRAKKELLHYGYIEITRPGGRNQCALYALSWHPINEIKGKPYISETRIASGRWKEPKPKFKYKPVKRPSKVEGLSNAN